MFIVTENKEEQELQLFDIQRTVKHIFNLSEMKYEISREEVAYYGIDAVNFLDAINSLIRLELCVDVANYDTVKKYLILAKEYLKEVGDK